MKLELLIKETKAGDVEVKMTRNASREPMTAKEAEYSRLLTQAMDEATRRISEHLGAKAVINLKANAPSKS